jgi:hypothetical protein
MPSHCAVGRKVFFTLLWQFFFINKKVAQYALLYTENKLQPQNRKSEKMKYGDSFSRKLFFAPLHGTVTIIFLQ